MIKRQKIKKYLIDRDFFNAAEIDLCDSTHREVNDTLKLSGKMRGSGDPDLHFGSGSETDGKIRFQNVNV
jgi:hypothetical protein